jgi:hypothetical protein
MSDLHELVAQLRHLDASAGEIATAISKRSDGYPLSGALHRVKIALHDLRHTLGAALPDLPTPAPAEPVVVEPAEVAAEPEPKKRRFGR